MRFMLFQIVLKNSYVGISPTVDKFELCQSADIVDRSLLLSVCYIIHFGLIAELKYLIIGD